MWREHPRRTAAAVVVGLGLAAVLAVALLPASEGHEAPRRKAVGVQPDRRASPRSTTTSTTTIAPASIASPVAQVKAGGPVADGPTPTTAPCPVQPLSGNGTWTVVDGASGSAQAPTCGILTDVGVPSRTQWITTVAPAASCTWTTFSSPTADPASTIATHTGAGQSLMAFTGAVAAVRAEGCGRWAPWPASDSFWLGRPSPSTTPFGDGTYPFWLGISDGTWQASGGPDCHWAVLRDFTGTTADVIESGSASSVTMAMPVGAALGANNHGGFSTQGCGTWTYVGGGSLG
jgi:hypothetical protein